MRGSKGILAIPVAPNIAPASLRDGITAAAKAWFADPDRPRLDEAVLERWSQLLDEWCEAPDLPLLIRKARDNRGHLIAHNSGRSYVPADNSPAHWSTALAHAGMCPSIDEVREMFLNDKIPVAMVIKSAERVASKYRCTRQAVPGPNQLGWKVAHINEVGLGYTQSIDSLPWNVIAAHFKRFLDPANMFLVPKAYGGVAETPEFLEAFRRRTLTKTE